MKDAGTLCQVHLYFFPGVQSVNAILSTIVNDEMVSTVKLHHSMVLAKISAGCVPLQLLLF
jgi:hypothetical protein